MYPALELDPQEELSEFSRLLWQRRISHMIRDAGDVKVLFVPQREQVAQARELFSQWRQGQLQPAAEDSADFTGYFSLSSLLNGMLATLVRLPVTLVTVATCIILALLTLTLGHEGLFQSLLYPDLARGSQTLYLDRIVSNLSPGQLFNMLSPALLHGGYVHLAFNMLWFWEFGKRIEARQSSLLFVAIIGLIAFASNTAQYLIGGGNNFVGMSGVVYGLLAYIWMWQLFDPRAGLKLPGALIFIMLLSLVLLTMADVAMIAHEAHVVGLFSGVLIGAVLATLSSIRRRGRHK